MSDSTGKRWSIRDGRGMPSPGIDLFLDEVHALCRKHGYYLEPGDIHGGLVVELYESDRDFEIVGAAAIGRTIPPGWA